MKSDFQLAGTLLAKTGIALFSVLLLSVFLPSCKDDDPAEPEEVLPDTFAIEFGAISFADLPVQFVIEDTTGSGRIMARVIFTQDPDRDFKGGFEMIDQVGQKKVLNMIEEVYYKVDISINNIPYESSFYTPIDGGYIDVLIDAEGGIDIFRR